jgi:hypothetical protein
VICAELTRTAISDENQHIVLCSAQIEHVGKAFVQHYYQTFHSGTTAKDFTGLVALYQPDSM